MIALALAAALAFLQAAPEVQPAITPQPEAAEAAPVAEAPDRLPTGHERLAQAEQALAEARSRDARELLEEALGLLDAKIAAGDGTVDDYLAAARAARLGGDAELALDYAEAVLQVAPGSVPAQRELAQIAYQVADLEGAALHAEAAARASKDPADWLFLSEVLDAQDDGLAAIEACTNALEITPGNVQAGQRLVGLLQRHDMDAEEVLNDLVSKFPDMWLLRMLYGDELKRRGIRDQAATFYEQAHQLAPKAPEPLLRLIPESHTEARRAQLPALRKELAELRASGGTTALAAPIYLLDEFDFTDHLVRVFENFDTAVAGASKYAFIVSEHPDFPQKERGLPSVRVLLRSDDETIEDPAQRPHDLVAIIGDSRFLLGSWDGEPAYEDVREQVQKFLLGDGSIPLVPIEDGDEPVRLDGENPGL